MKTVIQKVQCVKLTSIIFVIIRDEFTNILNFAEESFAKQNLLTIMKNLKTQLFVKKHKKRRHG